MSSGVAFLLLSFCLAQICEGAREEVIDDVTTIYKLPKEAQGKAPETLVEIHTRTNALGLAPLTELGYLEPVNVLEDLLCWRSLSSYHHKPCNWTTDGFSWVPSTDEDSSREDGEFIKEILVQRCRTLDYCPTYWCNMYIQSKENTREFYKIEIDTRSSGCGDSQGRVKLCTFSSSYPGNRDQASCDTLDTFTVRADLYLWFETYDNVLNIWEGLNRTRMMVSINDFHLGNSLKTIHTSHERRLLPAKVHDDVVELRSAALEGSSLTSPKFVAPPSGLCLLVLLNVTVEVVDESEAPEVLSAVVVDGFNKETLLETFKTLQKGEQAWRIRKSLPEELQGRTVNIVLRTLGNIAVSIRRIASCNVEDDEEISMLPLNEARNQGLSYNEPTKGMKAYFVSQEPKAIFTSESLCQNGGSMTDKGCACVAGFTAPDCSTACGRNRYGQDCEGKCSRYSEGCKGLRLCTPGAGCHCAPGYHSSLCDKECDSGYYGADCSQECGHCDSLEATCDKYTGHCERCQPGYIPPYCKHRSAYLKAAPVAWSDKYSTIKVSVDLSPGNIAGYGKPIFYQIQYMGPHESNSWGEWQVYTTQEVPRDQDVVELELEDLADAAEYRIRAVLILDDYNIHEDNDLPFFSLNTKCDIPAEYNYNPSVSTWLYGDVDKEFNYQHVDFNWSYITKDHWCPVVSYEVWWKNGLLWESRSVDKEEDSFSLSGVLPEEKVQLKVRAQTIAGYAPFSSTVRTSGLYDDKGVLKVQNLRAHPEAANSVKIFWEPPKNHLDHSNITYMLTYQCIKRPSCSTPCQLSKGRLNTKALSMTLGSLLPSAQYEVSVSPDSGSRSLLKFRTPHTVPVETPVRSNASIARTNSSLTVFWETTEVCSGFFLHYRYNLYLTSDLSKVIVSGTTRNTRVTFDSLSASTEYTVRVSIVTTGGWDPFNYLEISTSTSATVPEKVQDLVVYKRSRSMLGLRWAEPRALYGVLESFSISYSTLGTPVKTVSIKPTRCVPWPHLYCHTIESLKPSKKYNISVRSRNMEIHEDGAEAFVLGLTRENSPTSPQNLTVVNMTSTSLGLQWEHPDLANGVLRSFLVSVEETEQFDQDQCCQEYPIIEVPVNEERRYYQLEVAGLHPASSYTISISGKTVGFGPSQTLTSATRPPVTTVTPPQVLTQDLSNEWKWLPQTRKPEVLNSLIYDSLIKSHVLLVLTNTSVTDSGVSEERLKALLELEMTTPFYLAAEYNQGDSVTVGSGEDGECPWGNFSNPPLQSGQSYRLASVQISEYNRALNIATILSSDIQVL